MSSWPKTTTGLSLRIAAGQVVSGVLSTGHRWEMVGEISAPKWKSGPSAVGLDGRCC
jgi:hypothetical protein